MKWIMADTVIVPEKDIYNYDYCPRCGKYVGVKEHEKTPEET